MGINVKTEGLTAQAFEESVMINAENVPAGKLSIENTDMVEIKSGFNAGEKKLVLKLRGTDAVLYSWFPNKTAVGNIAEKFGDDTDKWKNQTIELETENVMVQGKKKKMIITK